MQPTEAFARRPPFGKERVSDGWNDSFQLGFGSPGASSVCKHGQAGTRGLAAAVW
jgi:hypothetical protein